MAYFDEGLFGPDDPGFEARKRRRVTVIGGDTGGDPGVASVETRGLPEAPSPPADPPAGPFTPPAGPYNPTNPGGDDLPPPAPPAPSPASTNWNTGGYKAPSYVATNHGDLGGNWGFSAENWNDPNMQTPKYVIGRLTAEAARQAGGFNTPQFESIFGQNLKNAYGDYFTYLGGDKVRGPDGVDIDIISNYGADNAAPWWWPLYAEDSWSGSAAGSGAGSGASGGTDWAAIAASLFAPPQTAAASPAPPPIIIQAPAPAPSGPPPEYWNALLQSVSAPSGPPQEYWNALLQTVASPLVLDTGPSSEYWNALLQAAQTPPQVSYTAPDINIDLPAPAMPPPEYWSELLTAMQTPQHIPAPEVNIAIPEPAPPPLAPVTQAPAMSLFAQGMPSAVKMLALKLPQLVAQRGSGDPLVAAIQALVGGGA